MNEIGHDERMEKLAKPAWDDEAPWPEPRADPDNEPAEPWARGDVPDEVLKGDE